MRPRLQTDLAQTSRGRHFLLVWINLAVSIIGGERYPADLIFLGVVGLAMAGALVARGRPQGMAIAMAATAAAMAVVAAVILAAGWNTEAWVLTASFVAPWLASAALFRKAAVDDRVEMPGSSTATPGARPGRPTARTSSATTSAT